MAASKVAGKRYCVEYRVSVFAYIEFEEDGDFEVTKVVVDDENVGEPVTVEYDNAERVEDEEEAEAVIEAVDGPDADWPGWEFGF